MSDAALNELQRHGLAELINVGVSRAATTLRAMISGETRLSVSTVDITDGRRAAAAIAERDGDALVSVRRGLEGTLAGRALLILPVASSLAVVRAAVHGGMPPEGSTAEDDILAEVGGIILDGCLAFATGPASSTDMPPHPSAPPTVRRGACAGPMRAPAEGDDPFVVVPSVDLLIGGQPIRGYIVISMDLPAVSVLRSLIAAFIGDVMGTEAVAADP